MKEHIIPSTVAAVVASAVALLGIYMKEIPAPKIVVADSGISQAKVVRMAAAAWDELSQKEVDDLTAALKLSPPPSKFTIVCADERWCGDVALNLDNSFESAHWPSDIIYSSAMTPPGWVASTQRIADMINAATKGRYNVAVDPAYPKEAKDLPEYVAIGQKPRAPRS